MTEISRFATIARWQALLIILLTALLIVSGIEFPRDGPPSKAPVPAKASDPDLVLYRTFAERVAKGDAYYPMAAHELRVGNYPLRPFVVFRLPTLTMVSATLGMPAMQGLLWGLILATTLAWWVRLKDAFDRPALRISATILIIAGLTIAGRPELVPVHEIWAGLLIALSFALHRSQRWWPSVAVAFIALMIRETVLPFVLLMGAFALWNRRWREVGAWGAIVALFAAYMWLHYLNVEAVTSPTDPPSPGWTKFGGWPNYIAAMRFTTALRGSPGWVSAVIVPIALLGWASWRSITGVTGFLLLAGYALMLMLFGRADNFYWGLLTAPLLLLGLMFAPIAIRDLGRAVRNPLIAAPRGL